MSSLQIGIYMSYENPWIFCENPFESVDIGDNYGFVYIITDLHTNKQYIGRKYFWSVRKQRGKKKRVRTESDWKNYYSSSKRIVELVEESGKDRFKREILSLHKTKGQVNYNEAKLQFKMDVLEALMENGDRKFYNDNIMSRYFTPKNPNYEKTQEHSDKISKTLKEKGIRPINCDQSRSEEMKLKMSNISKISSKFVIDNPNSPENITYTVLNESGIVQIKDLPKYCSENNIDYINLREWSKNQNRRSFDGKVKKSQLHKKYGMKILEWKNEVTGKSGVY